MSDSQQKNKTFGKNKTQRKHASKFYNKALFKVGVKAAEDLWHVDITDGKGVGWCSECEDPNENICIKKLILLNTLIKILMWHVNTSALSDSDLHWNDLIRPGWASLFITSSLYLTLHARLHRWTIYSEWLLCLCYFFISLGWNLSNCIIV